MSDADPDSSPLALATQAELIEELRRRFHTFFFIGRPNDARGCDWKRSYEGDIDRVIGLIEIGKHDLLKPTPDDLI